MARLAGFFAALAALLVCIGTYALLSHSVTARTREIATRMALGAGPAQVRALVLREGAALVLVGLTVGAAAAAAVTGVTASLLFGITPRDPVSILIAVAGMAAVTLISAIAPHPPRRPRRRLAGRPPGTLASSPIGPIGSRHRVLSAARLGNPRAGELLQEGQEIRRKPIVFLGISPDLLTSCDRGRGE